MNDHIADTARAVAARLADEHGPRLAAEVERELHEGDGRRGPDQYVDPTAIAGLIVSIASLAWTIYQDIRRRGGEPQTEVITRRIRVEGPPPPASLTTAERDDLITVVVEETTRRARTAD